jgi:hypothetical protein
MAAATRSVLLATVLAGLAITSVAKSAAFDQSFLSEPSRLQQRTTGGMTDYVYAVPDFQARFSKFPNGFFVDQPEVLVSPDSEYKGGKPEDIAAVSTVMRDALVERMSAGGYKLAGKAGPGVVVFRLALTDLSMKKKKRNLLAYTPVGAVVKVGADALRSMMDKVDITSMTLQAELLDGQTGEVMAAIAIPGDPSGKRLEFDDMQALVEEYSDRARCRIDNARVPANQQIDCFDKKARDARAPLPTQQ